MSEYICTKGFILNVFDEHESLTDDIMEVKEGSIWERRDKAHIAEVRLASGGYFLELDKATVEEHFTKKERG